MSSIRLEGITKQFGRTTAVDSIDLRIESGELFFLLGPSGCGKTTLLRMIAGFVPPTAGRILFDDRDVTHTPANRRNVGMVFQSYALWPHMTVLENVAFGLTVRRIARHERERRALEALDVVQMRDYSARKPNQLSGGQQQRVALARALVIRPTILLLDEPLSNLDAKLRLEMRSQIRQICRDNGLTGVYVTHDQKEALSMADRIAVLRHGQVAQIGSPRELYERPRTRFVADFLGEANFLSASVDRVEPGAVILTTAAGTLRSSPSHSAGGRQFTSGESVLCSLRPEALRILDHPQATPVQNTLTGRCVSTMYLGEMAQHRVRVAEGIEFKVLRVNPPVDGPPAAITLTVDPADVVIVEPD